MAEKQHGIRRRFIQSVAVYGTVWLACFVLYWFGLAVGAFGNGMIMGYTLLVLYCVLPVAGVVAAFLLGRSRAIGAWLLIVPIVIAALYTFFIMATFGLSTAFGFAHIAPVDFGTFIFGFIPAALGLAIAWLVG